ncbi:glucan endo-1,6-beta-glucosidase [Paenibacillus nanensis]|uniref:Glucan endo-1,6-beta-glucosidase n=1 Tax=Paenibacillus nanensis TaxID=393251 RepID=A0A3A1URS0_9BACL|nr:glycoside hydrolase family 30 beta sandwich domain-containing protein [Paenibacillus nanensis]RIX50944.1 glucan endo-1,6-beta-glucosidase [Paenibacillus nanensis]
MSRFIKSFLGLALVLLLVMPADVSAAGESVEVWMTNETLSKALNREANVSFGPNSGSNPLTIDVNENIRYQQMDGFGVSITDASAWLLTYRLSDAKRAEVYEKLFGYSGIGLSLLRQTIGASDFNWEIYSYNDTPNDPNLTNFSISRDMPYIVPRVKQALNVNPQLKVMAAAWSPPGWMKAGHYPDAVHPMATGYLQPQYYGSYANYLVKFIQAYQGQGIPIYAISPVNEPGLQIKDYPTTYMSTDDQINFIKNNLGPAIRNAGLSTKIMGYDFNWDNTAVPDQLLADPAVYQYLAGTAYHHYGGNPSAMTTIRDKYPLKDIWFTEGGFGTWNPSFDNMMWELITIPRNWSKSFIAWNLALDQNNGPTVLPSSINHGMLQIRSDGMDQVTYRNQYYAIGQFSKFVVPGAYRIATPTFGNMQNVAFKNPDGSKVVVAYNNQTYAQTVKVKWGNQSFSYSVPAKTAVTFKWHGAMAGANPIVAIKAQVNQRYVSADNGGSASLIANRTSVGTWEKFERIDLGNNNVAFRSLVNGKYVTAEDAGGSPLIARADAIGTWETFQIANVSGGVTLKSAANNLFVSAENAGAGPLIANRSTASGWETFVLEPSQPD